MRTTTLVSLLGLVLTSYNLAAQNWLTSGNALAANGTLGSTTNFSVLFKSNNSERGRLTNSGLWGFGTTAPNAKLHINSASGQIPLRVQINASTKFLVHSGGGVTIGSSTTPPVKGLYVSGNTGIGTATPVSKLEVRNGALTITNTTSSANLVINRANTVVGSSNQIIFQDNGVTKWAFGGTNIGSAGANNLSFYNYNLGSNALTVLNSNNNVGIGTASPASRLQVVAGYDGDGISVVGSQSGPKDAAFILVDDLGHHGSLGLASANNAFMSGVVSGDIILSNGGGKIHIGTGSASLFPTLTVDGGNVGIGTNSPAHKFSVTAAPASASPVAFIENTNGAVFDSDGLYIKAGSNTNGGALFINFLRPDRTRVGAIKQFDANSVSYFTTSDKRLKNIIGTTQKGLPDLMKIKIYDYTFKSDPEKRVQTGFMAQELYDIFPQSVSKPRENNEPAEKNPWMADYGRVTPLIIKSVQQQQQIIDEQKEKIAILEDSYKLKISTLEERIAKLEAALQSLAINRGDVSNITNASLEQNNPNPFTKNTIIRYGIPQGSKGQINIYDQAGKLVKTLKANADGQSQVNGHDLAAGAYTYTLLVNGKITLSKQMLIIK